MPSTGIILIARLRTNKAALQAAAGARLDELRRVRLLAVFNRAPARAVRGRSLRRARGGLPAAPHEARVLLVDDDRELCQMLTEYLQAEH